MYGGHRKTEPLTLIISPQSSKIITQFTVRDQINYSGVHSKVRRYNYSLSPSIIDSVLGTLWRVRYPVNSLTCTSLTLPQSTTTILLLNLVHFTSKIKTLTIKEKSLKGQVFNGWKKGTPKTKMVIKFFNTQIYTLDMNTKLWCQHTVVIFCIWLNKIRVISI